MKLFKVVCVDENNRRISCIKKSAASSLSLKYSKNFSTRALFNTNILVFGNYDDAKKFVDINDHAWETDKREIWEVYYWGKVLSGNKLTIPCTYPLKDFLDFWDRIKLGKTPFISGDPQGTHAVKTIKLKKRLWKNY